MMQALYIALGGALGTLARYLIGLGLARAIPGKLPWGTLCVNVLGSFVIGLVMTSFIARNAVDSPHRLALTVGALGGFTTYSAFAYEVVTLVQQKETMVLAGYLALLFVLSLGGCLLGIVLGRALA